MDLLLSPEQELLQASASKLLAEQGGVKRMRHLRRKSAGFERNVHEKMALAGWFGVLVPPEQGGLGLGLTELALLLMETGRGLAPEPVAPAAIAAYALSNGESSAASSSLLEKVVSGEMIVSLAIEGDGSELDNTRASLAAVFSSGRIVLDGTRAGVPLASASDGFIVAAWSNDDPVLCYVSKSAIGLTVDEHETVDGRSYGTLTFRAVSADHLIAAPAHAAPVVQALYDMMLIATAAELVGVMTAALDLTVEYLKIRKQFGKPIGSFQALQHRAVDNLVQVISTRTLLFQICDQGIVPSSEMASALKAYAAGEALALTKSAIQMHGAIGFTDEHDVGLYLKRAMWLAAYLGNESAHRKRFDRLSQFEPVELRQDH